MCIHRYRFFRTRHNCLWEFLSFVVAVVVVISVSLVRFVRGGGYKTTTLSWVLRTFCRLRAHVNHTGPAGGGREEENIGRVFSFFPHPVSAPFPFRLQRKPTPFVRITQYHFHHRGIVVYAVCYYARSWRRWCVFNRPEHYGRPPRNNNNNDYVWSKRFNDRGRGHKTIPGVFSLAVRLARTKKKKKETKTTLSFSNPKPNVINVFLKQNANETSSKPRDCSSKYEISKRLSERLWGGNSGNHLETCRKYSNKMHGNSFIW